MRLNKYIAQATGLSRRQADQQIEDGIIRINGQVATLGMRVNDGDEVTQNGHKITPQETLTLLLNKPEGYVSSRRSQDEKPTVYDLLPDTYKTLKVAGRLDAESCGLMIMTNDGQLAHQLMHPSNFKKKVYHVSLDHELTEADLKAIETGVDISDGVSKFKVEKNKTGLRVTMEQGRNRQIRRTFGALGYTVTFLQRVSIGPYRLDDLKEGDYKPVTDSSS